MMSTTHNRVAIKSEKPVSDIFLRFNFLLIMKKNLELSKKRVNLET